MEQLQNPELAGELLQMMQADQAMRNRAAGDMSQWDSSLDQTHMARMREIMQARSSWPAISEVGEAAATAAWCLVQHGDPQTDVAFMTDCLQAMKVLPPQEVVQRNIAYLEDRLLMYAGRPQLYGTQYRGRGATLQLYDLAEPATVQERRQAMGIEWPMDEDYRRLRARDR